MVKNIAVKTRLRLLILGILAVGLWLVSQSGTLPGQAQGPQDMADLQRQVQTQGVVRVIVGLDVPGYQVESDLQGRQAVEAQRQAIDQKQAEVLQSLANTQAKAVRQFEYIPYMALEVDASALQALQNDPNIVHLEADKLVPPTLGQTVPLIRAHYAQGLFYTGQGQTVAVLDTGVDKNHTALSGKVVSEACYSSNFSASNWSSLCPNGNSSSTANNSGLNCANNISGCDHGTHVAGIVAGVATKANLIAVQVFSRIDDSAANNNACASFNRTSPCVLANTSDIIAGLERVRDLRNTYNIAAVNMSLGGGQFTSTCNNDSRKSIIELLRGDGIATVIAAGNSGFRNAMGAPACISAAISVGATTEDDDVASYSNVSVQTTLFAPGSGINAPVPGNLYQNKNGTSMAAPHVAGAVAILKQARPNASVPDITNALKSSFSPNITDQRTGGIHTRRRLDVYNSLCFFITCDTDDYRTIGINQTLTGSTNPAADRDHYYFNATAGQRLTLRLNRTSGSMEPYVELYDPNGNRVAQNNNGGSGNNAWINGYLLQNTGRYLIIARSVNGTGNYQLQTSQEFVALNPVPYISSLYPSSATATPFGGNFWVRIYGQNFIPGAQAYWNGSYRPTSYSSSSLVWMRVYGSDIRFLGSRLVTVRNPTPGGGYSNPRFFNVTFPFLGESKLITPTVNSSTQVGLTTTFVISWTHPVSSWHVMQNMDLRLRDDSGKTAAWVRFHEGAGINPTLSATYRLLNGTETTTAITETAVTTDAVTINTGLPGENKDLVITDTVTLHLAQSSIKGTGQTLIMTPTLTFGPNAVGTYNIEFRVDNDDGSVQDDDVLGVFTVLPAGCNVALSELEMAGPLTGPINTDLAYSATISPAGATTPISYTWSPEPLSGQGTANATYSWTEAGEQAVAITAENCGNFVVAGDVVKISTGFDPDLAITKIGPAVAVAGQTFSYTLHVKNSGGLSATHVIITDSLPLGVTYVGTATVSGQVVSWTIPTLGGFGQEAQIYIPVEATESVSNSHYGVQAEGGFGAVGTDVVQTQLVSAKVSVGPLITGTLTYTDIEILLPAGSVFAETDIAYQTLSQVDGPLPGTLPLLQRSFRLTAYQANSDTLTLAMGETVVITLSKVSNPDSVLGYWQAGEWTSAGVTCTIPAETTLVCTIEDVILPLDLALLAPDDMFQVYLPLVIKLEKAVQITVITVNGSTYRVNFSTAGYTPALPGEHIHFFFNTVSPEQAGLPGSGPWYVYGGPSPFTQAKLSERPAGATQLCALVANANHSVQLGTGNCVDLP